MKKSPSKIILDTNILCSDFKLSSPTFSVFFNGLNKIGTKLCIPQVIIDEVKYKLSDELQKRKERIISKITELKRFTNRKFKFPFGDKEIQKEVEEYLQKLNTLLNRAEAIIVEYPSTPHQIVVQRLQLGKKPFSKKKKIKEKGYRDFLIWEAILSILEKDNKPIVFVTKDCEAFSNEKGILHPDLVMDIKERGFESDAVILCKDLKQFNDEYIIPTLDILEDIRIQLSDNKYPDVDLKEVILEKLSEITYKDEFDPEEIGFPQIYENPTIAYVQEVSNVEVLDVRRLPSEELIIAIEADVFCEFDFFIFKADFYTIEGTENCPFISDYDWNRHYVSASESKLVHILLNLTFNVKSRKATSIEIKYIYDAEPTYID